MLNLILKVIIARNVVIQAKYKLMKILNGIVQTVVIEIMRNLMLQDVLVDILEVTFGIKEEHKKLKNV